MNKIIERSFSDFIKVVENSVDKEGLIEIRRAFDFAFKAVGEECRPNGDPILVQSIEVAKILAVELSLGTNSIIAGILYNVVHKEIQTKIDINVIQMEFGEDIAGILHGMRKISSIGTETVDLHAENYRKLLLALAGDVRVIFLKISDRLYEMRNLDSQPKKYQTRLSIEVTHLYAPLAHRLGLYYLNSELLDLSLKYLSPDAYTHVNDRLKKTESERRVFVGEFVKPIEKKLSDRAYKFEMKARTKSIHSIWQKMQNKKLSFDEVYDLFAIRVILESTEDMEKSDCWQVYSIVTEEYQSNPERMRDWVTIPKSNGYESLHATVLGPHNKWIEVQIRTKRMDEIAEKGLAAHWKYKEGNKGTELEKWLSNVREILENPELNMIDFIEDFGTTIYSDEIFVFTPKGDLKRLPAGATLLDFAYEIHSEIGDRCVGGMLNGRKVSLRYKLKNGDQIDVDTKNNQKPKTDWLDFVVTQKAKNRIKSSVNEERKREAEIGKEILTRKLKNWKIEYNDKLIRLLLKTFNYKLAQDLYYGISTGKVDTLAIKEAVLGQEQKENVQQKLQEVFPSGQMQELELSGGDDYLVIDNNIKNVNHKLAPCCNPIFGDRIFGFITISDGIKIHRLNCPNAAQMTERYPYRIIKTKWKDTGKRTSFQATIKVSGTDNENIISQIGRVISKDIGVQMRSININSKKGEFEGTLRVFVNNLEHLDFLMMKLQNIKGVLQVSRADS